MIQSVFSTISQADSMSVAAIEPDADRHAPRDKPQHAVEDEAVNDVRGRIPVGEMLRVLRAHHHAVPEFYVSAGADRRAAHEEQDQRRERDDAEGEGEVFSGDSHEEVYGGCAGHSATLSPVVAERVWVRGV